MVQAETKPAASTRRNALLSLLLLVLSSTFAVCTAEVILRFVYPYHAFGAGTELSWMRENTAPLHQVFTVDPDFGFRPILGKAFSEVGTHPNSYSLQKNPKVNRVLFIGDSVTAFGHMISALRRVYGDENYEYWNAGVQSFCTSQEVEFYRRYNRGIGPDHVVLTFHNNDFQTTPVSFFNKQNQLVVYTPHTAIEDLSPWLFENSYLYRVLLGLRLRGGGSEDALVREVRESLDLLRRFTQEDGAKLTVLVLPILRPIEEWSPAEKRHHQAALAILAELDIRHFDLFPILQQGLLAGIELSEPPGDPWHPGDALSDLFARHLVEQNLLSDSAVVASSTKASSADVFFVADPNPIKVCDRSGLGATTLSWNATEALAVTVHVGSPSGQLFAATGARGSAATEKWVEDGMVFYLQDATGGVPLAPEHTLATLTVRLTGAGCP